MSDPAQAWHTTSDRFPPIGQLVILGRPAGSVVAFVPLQRINDNDGLRWSKLVCGGYGVALVDAGPVLMSDLWMPLPVVDGRVAA